MINGVMNIKTLKWALYCTDSCTNVTLQQVSDHLKNGGIISCVDQFNNDTTEKVYKKLERQYRLKEAKKAVVQ